MFGLFLGSRAARVAVFGLCLLGLGLLPQEALADSVQSLSALSLTSTAAGASHVSYSFQFTASATGGLAAQHGTITVLAPARTDFSSTSSGEVVDDLTTGHSNRDFGATVSGGGSTITVHVPIGVDINAGDQVKVELDDVVNPPAGSGFSLSVSTSSDTTPATTATYSIGSAHAVQSLSALSLTSTAAGASHVSYSFQFTASATGGLAAQHGTITVLAPAGTDFSSTSSGEVVDDLTTGHSNRDFGATVSGGGSTITVHVPIGVDINAGDQVKVELDDVVNPPAGSGFSLSVSTSSDTTPTTTATYSIGSAHAVQSLSALSLTSTAAGASHVSYSFQFTASATGRLASQTGAITVAAPAGTDFTSAASGATVSDLTSGQRGTDFGASTSNGGATITVHVPAGVTIVAGDQLNVELDDVVNAAAGSGYALGISTSSDTTPAITAPYMLTAAQAPQSLSAATLSSTTAGAAHVSYSLQFTSSATGVLVAQHGTITVAAPTDTVFTPPPAGVAVADVTTGQSNRDFGPSITAGGATITIHVPIGIDVHAGDRVSIKLDDVVNPPAGSGYSLHVSTSSDTVSAATPTYDVSTGPPLVGPQPAVTLSSDHLAFPVTGVGGRSATETVTLTDTGNAPLTIFAFHFNGATTDSFTITRNDCPNTTLVSGASCSVRLVFEPKDTGAHNVQLEFIDNAPGSPHTVRVTGTATGFGSSLTGHVYDGTHSNAPVAGALVVACSAHTCRQIQTASDGEYLLAGLPPGEYQAVVYPLSNATVGLIPPSALVTLSPGPATQEDFILTAPQPLSGGIIFAGETSGTPRYVFAFPTTTQVKLQVPVGEAPGTLGITLVGFRASASTPDPLQQLTTGSSEMLFVTYIYDNGGVPRFLTYQAVSTSEAHAALRIADTGPGESALGTWSATIGDPAPVAGVTDARTLTTEGTLTPNTSGAYHGTVSFGVSQVPSVYKLSRSSAQAATDRKSRPVARTAQCAEGVSCTVEGLVILTETVTDTAAGEGATTTASQAAQQAASKEATGGSLSWNRVQHAIEDGLIFNAFSKLTCSTVKLLCEGQPAKPLEGKPAQGCAEAPAIDSSATTTIDTPLIKLPAGAIYEPASFDGSAAIRLPDGDEIFTSGPMHAPEYYPSYANRLPNEPKKLTVEQAQKLKLGLTVSPDGVFWSFDTSRGIVTVDRHDDHGTYYDKVTQLTFPFDSRGVGVPYKLAHDGSAADAAPCPSGLLPSDTSFTAYADPSGTVATPTGAPVPAAKVVLTRSSAKHGRYRQVPHGSTVMSPANRRNPDLTTAEGNFGWDVLPGFYRVTASHSGCTAAGGRRTVTTKVLAVPPPVFNLRLVLRCSNLRRAPTRVSLLVNPMAGKQLLLIARVLRSHGRGRHRVGGLIVFTHGRRVLGRVPVDSRRSSAVLTVAGSGARNHGIRARYEGDGYNAPSPPSPPQ